MGESVRSSIRVLQAAGVPTVLNNLVDGGSANLQTQGWMDENPYAVNLVHMNPEGLADVTPRMRRDYFEGHYNIGYWAWELPDFPMQWQSWCSWFDEIWVPSRFVRTAVARQSPIPVVRIPHSIDVDHLRVPDGEFRMPHEAEGAWTVLFLFDFSSYWQRKNPFGVLEAFKRAFRRDERVALIIKTMHSECAPETFARLQAAGQDARVTIIDGVWDRADVLQLIKQCDCFVSLHRAEGFGLALAEAMALEKPVIATGYSGNTDFMNADNSLPVRFQLIELAEAAGPYPRGGQWADPDLEHAAERMRWVVAHPTQARALGRRAARTIRRSLSASAIGTLTSHRLRRIRSHRIRQTPRKGSVL